LTSRQAKRKQEREKNEPSPTFMVVGDTRANKKVPPNMISGLYANEDRTIVVIWKNDSATGVSLREIGREVLRHADYSDMDDLFDRGFGGIDEKYDIELSLALEGDDFNESSLPIPTFNDQFLPENETGMDFCEPCRVESTRRNDVDYSDVLIVFEDEQNQKSWEYRDLQRIINRTGEKYDFETVLKMTLLIDHAYECDHGCTACRSLVDHNLRKTPEWKVSEPRNSRIKEIQHLYHQAADFSEKTSPETIHDGMKYLNQMATMLASEDKP